MNQRTGRVGSAIEDAAAELGLSPAALRVHMADQGLEGVSPDLFQNVTKELKARANALRLDDLGKIALTVDWLADHALGDTDSSEGLKAEIAALRAGLDTQSTSDAVKALTERLSSLEAQLGKSDASESAKNAMQVAAGLQSVVESQGRELDQLRADLAKSQRELSDFARQFQSFTTALRSALGDGASGEVSAGKAKARDGESSIKAGQKSNVDDQQELISDEKRPDPANLNVPATSALRYGIRREIEYNFLLERMGYRRLDSYSNEELASGQNVVVPNDNEIQAFLARFEVGGSPEEVEIVTVHRGEFQMVQYQRTEKVGGLRGWMPKQKK